ncbi:MAG TPA: hypothetical protein VFI91_02830 [Longimicrobiaceae bacterium]|nr:hypothetical protein [Longimicrobiaceae bacterium]
MATLTTRTRLQGASVITAIPTEIARRLGIRPGRQLMWMEDGMGGARVVPLIPELAEAEAAHESIMDEYEGVFRKITK